MDKQKAITIVNTLEGFRLLCNEKHWDAKNKAQHNDYDNLLWYLKEFEDSFVENCIVIFDKFPMGFLSPMKLKSENIPGDILDFTKKLKTIIPTDEKFLALHVTVDNFLLRVSESVYLINKIEG